MAVFIILSLLYLKKKLKKNILVTIGPKSLKKNIIQKTLDVINKNSGIIDNVLVLINRMENTDDFLIQNDIKLNYVFSIIDFANILYDKSLITSTQKEILLSQF